MIKLPDMKEFQVKAEKIYNKLRDESRQHAVLTITAALIQAFGDGAGEVLRNEREHLDLILAKVESKIQ